MRLPIGLVLAGGGGRRMGRTKGDLIVEGERLALRAARTLSPLCAGVLISVRPGAHNPAPGYAAVEDALPEGRGPLAGIHAGFEATHDADLLVLACDYPRVETTLLERLLKQAEASSEVVLVTGGDGRVHPLVGLWRRRLAGRVAEALVSGRYKVDSVPYRDRVQLLGPGDLPGIDLDRVLVNLNLRADLDSLGRS